MKIKYPSPGVFIDPNGKPPATVVGPLVMHEGPGGALGSRYIQGSELTFQRGASKPDEFWKRALGAMTQPGSGAVPLTPEEEARLAGLLKRATMTHDGLDLSEEDSAFFTGLYAAGKLVPTGMRRTQDAPDDGVTEIALEVRPYEPPSR